MGGKMVGGTQNSCVYYVKVALHMDENVCNHFPSAKSLAV